MAKNIVCNVRMTEDERHALRVAALKNKTTVQDVLYKAARKYIAENDDDAPVSAAAEMECQEK